MSILTLSNVSYKYDKTTKNVLKGVSASFEAGKICAIVGKSGSGKTTLLSLIAGLDICTDGKILHGENDLRKIDRDEYQAKGVGAQSQYHNC